MDGDVIMFMLRRPDKKIETHIDTDAGVGYEGYGLLVCDLVRNVAAAFHVTEEDVWEWVDKERIHHTTPVLTIHEGMKGH